MTRFRTLLTPGQGTTPKEDQDRASQGLAKAVSQSHLHWWKKGDSTPNQGSYLLLAVAPYSQYDLTLLDVIDEGLSSKRSPSVCVYVVNLLDYDAVEQLQADFPGISQVPQTPLATFRQAGGEARSAWGPKARELAAEAIGIPSDELSRRIVAESPRFPGPV